MDIAVINNSATPILIGQVVRQTGFVQPQQLPSIALASASAASTAVVLGVAVNNIAIGATGQIRISGDFSPIDTSSFVLNAYVYLSNTPGAISATPGSNTAILGYATVISVTGCISVVCVPATSCSSSSGSGATGPQGATGLQGGGFTGVQGLTGISGGGTGLQGFTGISGTQGVTGLQGITGLQTALGLYRYSANNGVPSAGTRFLSTFSGIATSSTGDRVIRASVIRGISVRVNVIDASRSYDVNILSPSSGVPTIIATLTLPVSTIGVETSALSVAIAAGAELGAQMVRATGVGDSTFININVSVLLE